jgi:hypothetical protein
MAPANSISRIAFNVSSIAFLSRLDFRGEFVAIQFSFLFALEAFLRFVTEAALAG